MSSKRLPCRSAFTLVEILVTTLVMLIMVLAMSQMFALVGSHVTDGRAIIELQGQLRNAGFRIQEDLDGTSVVARQSPDVLLHQGYTEYIEGADDPGIAGDGIGSDLSPRFGTALPPTDGTHTAYGDIDDAIMFTARSTGRPFVGRSPVGTIESHDAEIIYWTEWNDLAPSGDGDGQIDLGEVTLHRRVLLVRPDLDLTGLVSPYASLSPADLQSFYSSYDLSVHPIVTVVGGNNVIQLVTNSLADLSFRENRVAHLPPGNPILPNATFFPLSQHFPNFFNRAWLPPTDDVVVADVLAFDVRAYDPTAPLQQADVSGQPAGDLLRPGDSGWGAATNHTVGQGAFVDLGYLYPYSTITPPAALSRFSHVPDPKSGLGGPNQMPPPPPTRSVVPTYDTWTWAYEHDGVNQQFLDVLYSVGSATDEATNGLDDDGLNGVDDPGEREANPPYAAPLRGIQITLRVVELDTRQVRQSSIVSRLMPE
jgi:hypothetical protein